MVVNRDEISVIVPNSKFTSESVINWTHSEHAARFNVEVGVSYGSDVRLVASVLKEAALENPSVLKETEPFVRLKKFNDSSIDFGVYFWTANVFVVEQTKSEIRFTIVEKFREKGITIPFPQRDLHVIQKENDYISFINKDL
jgi:small-conductance mechanosensitive channel